VRLAFDTPTGRVEVVARQAVVAGWTGRDAAAVEHHIAELAAIGVARPSAVPLYYRVAAALVTQAETVDVVGPSTSGEAEPVLIRAGARTLLTLGSDHTDRALEAHSVALAKQVAAKPLARHAVWLDTIEEPDALRLAAATSEDGAHFRPYQDGTLGRIRPLDALLSGAAEAAGGLADGLVLLCGTVPTLGGDVRPARHFRASLTDRGGVAIRLQYAVNVLPQVA